MKSILKIYWRYVQMACLLVVFVVFINLAVWLVYCIKTIAEGGGSAEVLGFGRGYYEEIAGELTEDADGLFMSEKGKELMKELGLEFALLLDGNGDVVWDWQLPEGIPAHFSPGDIGAFSRWYLNGRPVVVWRWQEEGLLVLAYPEGSAVRYATLIERSDLNLRVGFVPVFILFNVLLVFGLALLFGYRFYRSLKPVGQGIEALAEGKSVHLQPKGMTEYLKGKINQTSELLEKQSRELAARDRARTEWISGVSHDIRTPLSLIVGYADEIEQDSTIEAGVRQKAGSIRTQSFFISRLIEDLNLTSKLTYQAQPLRKESYMPAVWLRRTVADWLNAGNIPESCELELEIEPGLEKLSLTGDVQLLTRALQNLLGNSVRHNPGGCRIRLYGAAAEDGFCFCVKDDGKGVPKAVRDILEKEGAAQEKSSDQSASAWQEEALSDRTPHVMGLRVVRQIATAHGGRLWFEEEGRAVWVSVKNQEG